MEITLGHYIRLKREDKGWQQNELARQCSKHLGRKLSGTHIRNIENDEIKSPGFDLIIALKNSLGLTLAQMEAAYEGKEPDNLPTASDPLATELLEVISRHLPPGAILSEGEKRKNSD